MRICEAVSATIMGTTSQRTNKHHPDSGQRPLLMPASDLTPTIHCQPLSSSEFNLLLMTSSCSASLKSSDRLSPSSSKEIGGGSPSASVRSSRAAFSDATRGDG